MNTLGFITIGIGNGGDIPLNFRKHDHVFWHNFLFQTYREKGAWWEGGLESFSFLKVRVPFVARELASFSTQTSFIGFTECVVEKNK